MLARWWRPLGWLISKAHGARGTVALRRSRWPRNIVDARKEFPPDLFLRNPQNEQEINAKDKISMSKTGPSIFFSLLTTNFTRYGIVPRCRALILSSWWWTQIASMIDWLLDKRQVISNIKIGQLRTSHHALIKMLHFMLLNVTEGLKHEQERRSKLSGDEL